ncbi:UvrD-helicase domain-containing protein [Ligilactobacillus acidipiscis]|uniref:UvrD-helicase domain-containing protein n=1 Tax=Ligilactobacillus acidipiscis TaxID=89059 RepID=UPI00386DC81F
MNNDEVDKEQLQVVNSKSKRLIVEAPAGFGKTYTMVKMLSNWLDTSVIKNHKMVLCLSFSISAAKRMKESIKILQRNDKGKDSFPIRTTNFHGFCRSVLKKYGNQVRIIKPLESYNNLTLTQVDFYDSIPSKVKSDLANFEENIKSADISEKSCWLRYLSTISIYVNIICLIK